MISFIYVSLNRKKIRISGETSIARHIPWVSIIDFNAILSLDEKIGGLSPGKRCPYFGEFMETIDLYDMGFRGFPFTWHRGNLFERLDHALGNEA